MHRCGSDLASFILLLSVIDVVVFVRYIRGINPIPAVSEWNGKKCLQIGALLNTLILSNRAFFFFFSQYCVMAEHKEEEQPSFIVRLILQLLSPGGWSEEEE